MARIQTFLEKRALVFDREGCRAFLAALRAGDRDAGCRAPMRPASVAHAQRILKSFCSWAVEEGLLTVSPLARVPLPKIADDRKRILTDDELEAVMQAASNGRCAVRDVALLSFLADTGVRAAEACGLLIQDVDLQGRRAVIRRSKGGDRREVSFGATCARKLWALMKTLTGRGEHEHLFQTERGRPFTPDTLRQLMDRVSHDAGVRAHAHMLRHSAATRLLQANVNSFVVQRQLGHKSISTTQKYAHLNASAVAKAYEDAAPLDVMRRTRRKGA